MRNFKGDGDLNNLKKRRQELQLTQKELARKAAISERHYQKIETAISMPAVDIAIRLAEALHTTVESLFLFGAGSCNRRPQTIGKEHYRPNCNRACDNLP